MLEATAFREDVSYLTKETERLLNELKEEKIVNSNLISELQRVGSDFEQYQHHIPNQQERDRREISCLRDLKHIIDRDKETLQSNVEQLHHEKDNLIT